MDIEAKVILGLIGFLIAAAIIAILTLEITDYAKDARAIDAGYQECQKLGDSGTVWQHECVFTMAGDE